MFVADTVNQVKAEPTVQPPAVTASQPMDSVVNVVLKNLVQQVC